MYSAIVITVSDKCSEGQRADTSGPLVKDILNRHGFETNDVIVVPDEKDIIADKLISYADCGQYDLIVTTGGTGFAKRDVTPEATECVITKKTPGISELMRSESMKITKKGCLSRGISGIRNNCLIINLPGSEKAASENLMAVIDSLPHGIDMMHTVGSAECGGESKKKSPDVSKWLNEAKMLESAGKIGMYLIHNGVVRETTKAAVYGHDTNSLKKVLSMDFSYDDKVLMQIIEDAKKMPGIGYLKIWLNSGHLNVGDDLMYIIVGADTRVNCINALEQILNLIKNTCVCEKENV